MRRNFFLVGFIFFSCSNTVFEEILFRTTEDPYYDVPVAKSLDVINQVSLNWSADAGCDTYCLMRSLDGAILSFSCIYQGSNLNYIDNDIISNSRYIYRLDKIRGQRRFIGREYAYGFGASIRRDDSEYNDDINSATFLEYDLYCTLPCVSYITNGIKKIDKDWFYVTVPPRRTAVIILQEDNIVDKAQTSVYQQIDGMSEKPVMQNVGFNINNPSYVTKNIYFKIYPDETRLFGANSYTSIIQYKISLYQIINYKDN